MLTGIMSMVIVINEVMASNAGMVMSPATNFDSWIELYNPTDETIVLGGMYLSDDPDDLKRWKMPSAVGGIPAKGYQVIWLGSNDIRTSQAPFNLDCDGGTICLSDKDGHLVATVDYPEAMSRTSYARTTDGGSEWGWTAQPTPGASNATSVFASGRLSPPVVSQGSRLFSNSMTVTVDIPEGTTLLYTTDCSMPMQGEGTARQSQDGVFSVTQTTNFVFRLFQDGYLPSPPVTRSYIMPSAQYTVPIISIVGDERYFTDDKWGIDIKGTNGIAGNGRNDPVNWNRPWDRPVNFSYISPTEGMLFNQDVNISVSGGWSRMSSPRSMKLKSNKVFDGMNHLDYAFFPQKPYIRSKTILMRNGGNNSYARFMDPALTTIVQRSGIDLDVQSTVQFVEYLNGRFKGVLNLREPTNDKFVYANFGYDDDELDMFENGNYNNGDDVAYRQLLQLAEKSTTEGAYDEVKTLLDVDEFSNYMAAELFLGNDDWPNNNVKAYRSRNDGRYRFILFDLDQPFNKWGHTISSLSTFTGFTWVRMFQNLLKLDEYRRKFIDTFCLMAGSVFEKDRAIAIVDELADSMRPMLRLDNRTPDGTADTIRSNLRTRMATAITQLQQYAPMKLNGARKQSVTLEAATPGATLLLNGIQVPYASFKGYLFPPVTIEAKAPAGYTFTGWRKGRADKVTVFDIGESWKYYDRGRIVSYGWTTQDYYDKNWASGLAPLGYKMAGVNTTVSYGSDAQHKNITTYFRKQFTLDDEPAADDTFLLNYGVDDGCVVWVNGKEAGRVNMPDGNISYGTVATTYAGNTPLTGTLSLSPSLFVKGSNIIAVEVHNNSESSSDLYWEAALLTTVGADTTVTVLTDPVIELPADDNISLLACFTPLTAEERMAQGICPIRINEVSAANDVYVNEYFKRNDWIELCNTTDGDVDVAGMYLTDDVGNPLKYPVAATDGVSTVIPAGGRLVVWCDKQESQSQLHVPLKLSAAGGEVMLTAADESWSDVITYTPMRGDETVGRYPDGSSSVITMNVPTIGKANITGSYAAEVVQPQQTGVSDRTLADSPQLSVRYVEGRLVVSSSRPAGAARVDICNLAGLLLRSFTLDLGDGRAEWTADDLSAGCYIARVTAGDRHAAAACKFVRK